jgi:hypothetical protein
MHVDVMGLNSAPGSDDTGTPEVECFRGESDFNRMLRDINKTTKRKASFRQSMQIIPDHFGMTADGEQLKPQIALNRSYNSFAGALKAAES